MHVPIKTCLPSVTNDSHVLGSALVITNDPSAAEIIHQNEGKYPSRGPTEDIIRWFFSQRKEPPPFAFE